MTDAEPRPKALVVFARAPEPGRVKTRLAAGLGDAAALALYRAFLDDTLAVAAEAARRTRARLELAVAGPAASLHAEAQRFGAALAVQPDGDLGARMRVFLDRELARGGAACVIGSDVPQLPVGSLERALDALDRDEVVLGPSRDGGYWLIGARRGIPEAFAGVPWSTPDVLAATLDRLAGRRVALADMHFDIDDADDLALLRRWLAVSPPEVAPATRRALAATLGS